MAVTYAKTGAPLPSRKKSGGGFAAPTFGTGTQFSNLADLLASRSSRSGGSRVRNIGGQSYDPWTQSFVGQQAMAPPVVGGPGSMPPPIIAPSGGKQLPPGTMLPPQGYSGGSQSSPFALNFGQGNAGLDSTNLLQQLEAGRQQANLGNEQRYLDILEQKQAGRDRLLGQMDQYGAGQRARIDSDYTNLLNSSLANLQARGLRSSTLDPVTRLGVQRQRQLASGELEDRIIGMRTDLERQLEQDLTGFQERKSESGPTLDQIIQLSALLGGGGGNLQLTKQV